MFWCHSCGQPTQVENGNCQTCGEGFIEEMENPFQMIADEMGFAPILGPGIPLFQQTFEVRSEPPTTQQDNQENGNQRHSDTRQPPFFEFNETENPINIIQR